MKKPIVLLAVLSSLLVASETEFCSIPDELMEAVAEVESGYTKGGYPYVVGINGNENIKIAKALLGRGWRWLDSRSIDCANIDSCIKMVDALLSNGVDNIDVGRYQISHKWHHQYARAIEDYFVEPRSRSIACRVIEDCVQAYGYSWYGVSCYHSRTPSRNSSYSEKLKKALVSLKKQTTNKGIN